MSSLNNLYINNLYLEGNKQKIQTFKLIPNYEKIDEFVSEEITKVPSDEIILRRDNPISFWSFKRKDDVVYDCEAYSLRKNSLEGMRHYLDSFVDSLKSGESSCFSPEGVRCRYKNGSELYTFDVGYLPYSIQTTENLYKLGLIENHQFDSVLLHYSDLSEVAELFSLSDEIYSQDLEELDRLIAYGIVPENKDRIINYQNTSKVYKNLRQHYK